MDAEPEKNLAKAMLYVRKAAMAGAQIVCLPELFNLPYFCFETDSKHCRLAESIPGPATEAMGEITREKQIVAIVPVFEKAMSGQLFNTAAVIGPDGQILGKYRKSHLPELDAGRTHEKFYFAPGDTGFETFSTPFGITIGILICWDRFFPEAVRSVALNGAHVLFVPAAVPGRGRPMWETVLRAAAYTNQFYVGGVNRTSNDAASRRDDQFFGSSLFASPSGTVLSQAGDHQDETVYADLDLDRLE